MFELNANTTCSRAMSNMLQGYEQHAPGLEASCSRATSNMLSGHLLQATHHCTCTTPKTDAPPRWAARLGPWLPTGASGEKCRRAAMGAVARERVCPLKVLNDAPCCARPPLHGETHAFGCICDDLGQVWGHMSAACAHGKARAHPCGSMATNCASIMHGIQL